MPHNTPEYRQQLAQEGRHVELFQALKEVLETAPDNPNLLYNTGLSAYLSGQFAEAATYWTRLKNLVPQDFQVRAKLVQVYEALQDSSARDAERAELFALHDQLETDANKPAHYCRDQFRVGERTVLVYEHFELVGDMAVRYGFQVFRGGGQKPECTLSLGSYATTNQYMHQRSMLQPNASHFHLEPDERLFHLDEYRDNAHRTLAFYKNEPPYDVVKAAVQEILCQPDA